MKNITYIRHEETRGVCGELPEASPMTDAEMQRIKMRALSKITPRRRRPRRFALVAAVLVCMFALIACSAEIFHWNYRFSALLNLEDRQKTYAEKNQLAQDIKKPISAECNGLKISLRQTITDGSLCYLIFDAELPENWAYLADEAPIVEDFWYHGLTDCSRPQTLTLPQDMSTDSNLVSMYVVGFIEEGSDTENIPFTIVFKDFYYHTISSIETVRGLWSLSCEIDKNDKSVNGKVDIPYEITPQDGSAETGRIISYSLSPLSLSLEYVSDRPDPEASGFYSEPAIEIRYKDGTTVSVKSVDLESDQMGGYLDREINEQVNYHKICLDQLINIEQVSEIIYNGSVIPVNQ